MKDFFEDYKPIRNRIRKFYLWDILTLFEKIQQNSIIPEVIEFTFLNSIVYASNYPNKENFNQEKEFNIILTQTNKFYNDITEPSIKKNSLDFIQKISLNQLKSNTSNYFSHLYRYYYIFSSKDIVNHIDKKIEMPYKDFFVCSMWLHSIFFKKKIENKSYFLNKKYDKTVFSRKNMEKTLKILSKPLSEFKENLKKELIYNENAFITHGYSHTIYPIIEDDNKLYCFNSDNLIYQFTSGIYYIAEIYKKEYNLGNTFGSNFENYVGLILEKNNASYNYSVKKEFTFNNGQKKTSDWIIETDNAIVFIECKTKRLQIKSKDFNNTQEKDIEDISEAIKQIYKVYNHYINNDIPQLVYNPNKKFIPIILTLEDLYAGLDEQIKKRAKEKLNADRVDAQIIEKHKFLITSINNFETEIQLMFKFGFENNFRNLSRNNFNYIKYFEKEIEETFIKPYED